MPNPNSPDTTTADDTERETSDAAAGPVARSPIHQIGPTSVVDGWEVSQRNSKAALRLADWTCAAKVAVRAAADSATAHALGVPFRRAAWRGRPENPVLVVGSGPGEWFLIGLPGTAAGLMDVAMARSTTPAAKSARRGTNPEIGRNEQGLVSVVDLTHGRALVRMTGSASAKTLAKVCPIDLRDRTTPDGTAFRSTVGRLTVDVVRDDVAAASRPGSTTTAPTPVLPSYQVRSYLLHCERSTGQHLFDLLLDAGAEFQIDIDGFRFEPNGSSRP